MYNHAERRRPKHFWQILLGLLVGWTLPFAVSAESSNLEVAPAPPPAPPAHLVRELLEQDARRALLNEQMGNTSKSSSARSETSISLPKEARANDLDEPLEKPTAETARATVTRLKAIVGVDGKLSAIVEIDGREAVYRAGQALPTGGHSGGLRLVRIATPCVELADPRHEPEARLSACLNEGHR